MKSEHSYNRSVTIFSGGVGGAKFVLGMYHCIPHANLNVIVNTADDTIFHGLHIAPDLDTVMYTLSGLANPITGWGVVEDSFNALAQLKTYGQASWFQLGDRDLATHILRTKMLYENKRLTEITSHLSKKLGIESNILPMTDDRIETNIKMDQKWISFQEYFVLGRAKGSIASLEFKGIEKARPTKEVLRAIEKADLIIFAPSNPVVSILPILSLKGVKEKLAKSCAFKVAVSPFISNRAISGPAKDLMEAIGQDGSSLGLADFYKELIDTIVIDESDVNRKSIEALGIQVKICKIFMNSLEDKIRLAKNILYLQNARIKNP